LTEQFKTNNALLQNSLAYFELFSARLAAQEPGSMLVRQVSDCLLRCCTSRWTPPQPPPPTWMTDWPNFRSRDCPKSRPPWSTPCWAHARMLRALLPETDQTVRALFVLPNERVQSVIRELLKARKTAAKSRAELYRFTLYAVSLLLVGLLIRLGVRLQSRA